MSAALHVVFIINCLFLILVVLVQAGRGGGLSEMAGSSSGAAAAFGASGTSTLLQKLTAWSAGGFMMMTIALAILASKDARVEGGQFVDEEPSVGSVPVPAEPSAE